MCDDTKRNSSPITLCILHLSFLIYYRSSQTCLVFLPQTCRARVPCSRHNHLVGSARSSTRTRPELSDNCIFAKGLFHLIVMDPSDAVEVWYCSYVLSWATIKQSLHFPCNCVNRKKKIFTNFSRTHLWQRVWFRPLEVVRDRNYVCVKLQSCWELSPEIVVFFDLW